MRFARMISLAMVVGVMLPTPAGAGVGDHRYIGGSGVYEPFAMWTPNYCGVAYGYLERPTSTEYFTYTSTLSTQNAGGGFCNVTSPAAANVVANQPRLEQAVWGGWAPCKTGPWDGNGHGGYEAEVYWSPTSCDSSVPHRLQGSARITYGGHNYYDTRATSGI